jgi:hypothetical protein
MVTEAQITDTLLMVRPGKFIFNSETATSNIFQKAQGTDDRVHVTALKEFDALVKILREHKIYVIVLQDHESPPTPDSIFPNNWVSFHQEKMIIYPMLAENRRLERKSEWIELIKNTFNIGAVRDLSSKELEGKFLEGTGSLALDRKNKIAFANLSSRTDHQLLQEWCDEMKFELISFTARTNEGKEIYHTNVMIAIGEKIVVICSELITNPEERKNVLSTLSAHHRVIEISEEQVHHFAGNMLLVKNRDGEKFWVMSEQAFQSLYASQKDDLKTDGEFLSVDLKTIETTGGGSARCMLAEVF